MTDTTTRSAKLVSGYSNVENSDLIGLSIASIRNRYGSIASIPSGARATVNSHPMDEGYTLVNGDELVFDMPTGSKG